MTPNELALYYLQHKDEFLSEEPHEFLLSVLKQKMKLMQTNKQVVAIDAGSCIGDYITNLKTLCPEQNTKILCIEPNPLNLQILRQKVLEFDNTIIEECCVSNENDTVGFFNWRDARENHVKNEIGGLRAGGEKICDVDVKRLDHILNTHFGLDADIDIKFVKIDTEGNDGNVIKGMGNYLKNVHYMIFECSNCLDDHRGPGIENPMKDIVDYLSSNGFDTYRIGTEKLFKVNDEYWNDIYEKVKFWSNCFAIKKGDPFIQEIIDNNFNYI